MTQSSEQYTSDSCSLDLNSQREKERIFEIKKYTFLKRKRQEAIEKYQTVRPWSTKEDATLKDLMYQSSSFSWKIISAKLKGRTPSQCRDHWKMNLKPEIRKGKWTREEDEVVLRYVEEHGTDWGGLQLILQERTTKQIRERWVNHLSKNTSQFKWTKALDKALIELYIYYGSSWVKIASFIDGTTENMVKNRFYGLLRGTVAKYKKSDKVIGEKVKRIRMELKEIDKEKHKEDEGSPKLSDYSLLGNDNDSFEKIVNNPYVLSKSKNYSLKILIEFLPLLIEDLDIDIKGINVSLDNYILKTKSKNDNDNEENDYMTEDINMNTLSDEEEDCIEVNEDDAINDDISMLSITNHSSQIDSQVNLLSKVFEQHDKQKMQSFFSCYRNNALQNPFPY